MESAHHTLPFLNPIQAMLTTQGRSCPTSRQAPGELHIVPTSTTTAMIITSAPTNWNLVYARHGNIYITSLNPFKPGR